MVKDDHWLYYPQSWLISRCLDRHRHFLPEGSIIGCHWPQARLLSSKSMIIKVFLHRFYFLARFCGCTTTSTWAFFSTGFTFTFTFTGFVDAQQPRPGRLSARGNCHRHREEEKDVKYHDCQVLQFMTENKWNNVPNLCVKN